VFLIAFVALTAVQDGNPDRFQMSFDRDPVLPWEERDLLPAVEPEKRWHMNAVNYVVPPASRSCSTCSTATSSTATRTA